MPCHSLARQASRLSLATSSTASSVDGCLEDHGGIGVLDEADDAAAAHRPAMREGCGHRPLRRAMRADIPPERDDLLAVADEGLGLDLEACPVAAERLEQPLDDGFRTA